jgi:hypothetical protein
MWGTTNGQEYVWITFLSFIFTFIQRLQEGNMQIVNLQMNPNMMIPNHVKCNNNNLSLIFKFPKKIWTNFKNFYSMYSKSQK